MMTGRSIIRLLIAAIAFAAGAVSLYAWLRLGDWLLLAVAMVCFVTGLGDILLWRKASR